MAAELGCRVHRRRIVHFEPVHFEGPSNFESKKAFDKKTEELTKLKKSEKFCNFLTSQLLNEKCNGQPIDALLIRPIQRIPSLLLLYKGTLKNGIRVPVELGEP